MNTAERVEAYLANQPESKQKDLRRLHGATLDDFPHCRLWMDEGLDAHGTVVSNPTIGYGQYRIAYANGSSREFYRIGLSANAAGISLYVMGLEDKTYLQRTFGSTIGTAKVTGYCIRFRGLAVVNPEVLRAVIHHGMTRDDEF